MRTKHLTLKRALFLSAPFLFIALAIFFLTWAAFMIFIDTNIYFSVATNAPENLSLNEADHYKGEISDKDELESLKQDNEGLTISNDFPPITIGQQWATITIESAGVYDIPVYHGGGETILMKGIGHSTNSRFPGQNGRIVLSGHVGISRFFQRLETMSLGDRVILNTIYGEYVYEVTKTEIHEQTENYWILPLDVETEDELICYTCYPFNTTRPRTQRFAIVCKKVSGKDWTTVE